MKSIRQIITRTRNDPNDSWTFLVICFVSCCVYYILFIDGKINVWTTEHIPIEASFIMRNNNISTKQVNQSKYHRSNDPDQNY